MTQPRRSPPPRHPALELVKIVPHAAMHDPRRFEALAAAHASALASLRALVRLPARGES